MTDRTLNKHIADAIALKNQIKTLEKALKVHEDKIKMAMTDNGQERITYKDHKISYINVISNVFDRDLLFKVHPELDINDYKVQKSSMRFTIA